MKKIKIYTTGSGMSFLALPLLIIFTIIALTLFIFVGFLSLVAAAVVAIGITVFRAVAGKRRARTEKYDRTTKTIVLDEDDYEIKR